MSTESVLVLTGMGVPEYSARGLSQVLTPVRGAADLRRIVNGTLINLSVPEFEKYLSVIRGSDQEPPAVEAVWPGLELTVDCIVELAYITTTAAPERTVVASREANGFTFYRPRLTMLVLDFQLERDEWGDVVAWTLELEEK